MHTTRLFLHDGEQAVSIPEELAYTQADTQVEIERLGDEIRIRPVRRSLAGVLSKFARFSPGFMGEGRGEHEQSERNLS